MHVGIVTPRYPPVSSGGGELSSKLLADHLLACDRIDSVTVLAFDGTAEQLVDGVSVHRLGAVPSTVTEYQNLRAWVALRERLADFDIVHAYNMELHPVVGYLSYRLGVPSVGTLNSYHFFPKSVTNVRSTGVEQVYEIVGHPTTGRVMLSCVRRIDLFVALSRAIKGIYESHGFDGSRIDVVPNMIDPEFGVPEVEVDRSGIRLLYVGSLTANKGVQYLIRAVGSLPESYSLRVIGDGDRSDALRSLAGELEVRDRVEFVGRIPYEEVSAEYATSDVFVHPGVWPEPLNRTVLEAMQAGLPVVCTDVGGPPEVVPDDELLCEPGDPRALAGTIERAAELGPEVGERNRRHVNANYHPLIIVPQIVDRYEALVERT